MLGKTSEAKNGPLSQAIHQPVVAARATRTLVAPVETHDGQRDHEKRGGKKAGIGQQDQPEIDALQRMHQQHDR